MVQCITQGQFDSTNGCDFDFSPLHYGVVSLNAGTTRSRLAVTLYSTTLSFVAFSYSESKSFLMTLLLLQPI